MSQTKLSANVYNKTNAKPFANGSVSLNGSSYVTVPGSSLFNFGTGDFTVETFVRITTSGAFQGVFQSSTDNLNFQRNGSGNLEIWDGSSHNSSTAISTNTWYHVAICRSSGTARAFVNGTQAVSWSSSVNYTSSMGFILGYTGSGNYYMTGNVSNFRVTNTALYTANFTAPTARLKAVTGTRVLTVQDADKIVDNSGNALSITTSGGGAAASSANPF